MQANAKDLEAMSSPWPRIASESGEQASFERLFRAHYPAIYAHLCRIVGSRQEAEDLAQEAFLRLYRQRFAPEGEHNVRAWLYKVATNLAYNALRDERRRERRHQQAAGSPTAEEGDGDPAEATLRQDEHAAVRGALAALPDRQAQLLLLRHAGLSYREISAALGVAAGSVGTLLARAQAAFERAYLRLAPEPRKEVGHEMR
jgi:RNA polymerase sigma-70 factor (ECF subfamily)